MQATTMSGTKLEKRYSPSFHEDSNRKQSASKRKRDDVLRLVLLFVKKKTKYCEKIRRKTETKIKILNRIFVLSILKKKNLPKIL